LIRKEDGRIEQQFVNLSTPIARVSTLCIHLQSPEERKAFAVNKETHTSPIIGTQTVLERGAEEQLNNSDLENRHEPALLQAIAKKLGVKVRKWRIWNLIFMMYSLHHLVVLQMNSCTRLVSITSLPYSAVSKPWWIILLT
jgi:aspartyl aminopeptidase